MNRKVVKNSHRIGFFFAIITLVLVVGISIAVRLPLRTVTVSAAPNNTVSFDPEKMFGSEEEEEDWRF